MATNRRQLGLLATLVWVLSRNGIRAAWFWVFLVPALGGAERKLTGVWANRFGFGSYTWIQQKEYFDCAYSNAALLKSLLEGAIGYAEDETHNLRDFIQANLRRVVFGTPEKEVEIQNGIESLIVGRGMAKGKDYDRETGRVKTSGKESIPDFIFPNLNLCLEVKLSNSREKLRSIVDEINADIRAYTTRYDRQLYIVYDLGTIRDEAEFRRDLEDARGVSVVIVKH